MKFFALRSWALLAVLGFYLTACSSNDDPAPTTSEAPATTITRSRVSLNLVQYTIKDFGRGIGTFTMNKLENAAAEGSFAANANARVQYILDGLVFVNDGQVLTVQAGAIIKARSGTGDNASALVVARGGRISAAGTATDPIVMTAEADNLVPNTGTVTDYSQLNHGNLIGQRGLWGGLVLLGRASLNRATAETNIEGIPSTNVRGLYGGTNDADNSGTVRYMSIRHTGTDIGAGNELQGLTLGGVGSATTVEYVESIYSNDDGIEIFGGTVNTKWILVAFNDDDAFDYDQGWRGWNQFWVAYSGDDVSNRGCECDGDDSNASTPSVSTNGTPFTRPYIFNATLIGRKSGSESQAMEFRANSGGLWYNVHVEDFNSGPRLQYEAAAALSSWRRFRTGNIAVRGAVFNNIGTGVNTNALLIMGGSPPTDSLNVWRATYGTGAGTTEIVALGAVSTGLNYPISTTTAGTARLTPAGTLDLVPDASISGAPAAITTGWPAPPAGFTVTTAAYLGAFDPAVAMNASWISGWTKLDRANFF